MSRRARERGDKRERWDFQPDWREERDKDDDELPERDDDDPPPQGAPVRFRPRAP